VDLIFYRTDIMKIGIGKDSHKFLKNKTEKPLIIGGVKIDDLAAFDAHSDGDVLCHSLFNAISSALGKKSIGFYFPNTSQKDKVRHKGIINDEVRDGGLGQKDQNSRVYLEKAKSFLEQENYNINNISIAIECAKPNIDKIENKIKKNIAQIFNIKTSEIGIAATTGEGATPWGKGEGVEVISIISIKNN